MRRWLLRLPLGLLVLAVAGFVVNGTSDRWRVPDMGTVRGVPAHESRGDRLVVVAWNLAKLGLHRGGFDFASAEEVERRMDAVAAVLVAERADLVFLSEVVAECGPVDVDQVRGLARRTGLVHWAFSENYSFGVPGFRIRSGNGVLSRFPLSDGSVQQLVDAQPFWSPTGNRRLLWCDVDLGPRFPGSDLLRVGSLRNDSFDLANNARQVREILHRVAPGRTLLAGDFNAEPQDEAMQLFGESALFVGNMHGPPTFPAADPTRRIDYVLAPAGWELLDERTPPTQLSDHRPVITTLRIPR